MGFAGESKRILRTRFISGLLVVVPLILTFVLLRSLVESIDSLLRPVIVKVFGPGYDWPFVGVAITLAVIMIAGILASSYVGRRLVKLWDKQLSRIPIINFIYGAAKQLIQSITIPQSKSFKSVVMVEYPRKGAYALGFLANEINAQIDDKKERLLSVFIASSPLPFSGFIVLFPEKDVKYLNMTVEQGIKFFVSGSIITPDLLAPANSKHILEKQELDAVENREGGSVDESK